MCEVYSESLEGGRDVDGLCEVGVYADPESNDDYYVEVLYENPDAPMPPHCSFVFAGRLERQDLGHVVIKYTRLAPAEYQEA